MCASSSINEIKTKRRVMKIRYFDEPIIIVGFGHSGSRLLAALLSDCGIFQVQNTPSKEWSHIQKINDRIWRKWYDIDEASEMLIRKHAVEINKTGLLFRLFSRGYHGGRWGIKDPRLTITLPAWLEKFPKAKVIHLVRNPLDVIGTLSPNYAPYTPGGKLPQEKIPFWADLWMKSLDWVLTIAVPLGDSQFAELKYEDLCADAKGEIERLFSVLRVEGCDGSRLNVSRIQKAVNKYESWLKDGKLKQNDLDAIASSTSRYMTRYGYVN
jgi:hypothetical protein